MLLHVKNRHFSLPKISLLRGKFLMIPLAPIFGDYIYKASGLSCSGMNGQTIKSSIRQGIAYKLPMAAQGRRQTD